MKANQVLLIGYVGQHLESKKTANGLQVKLRVATHNGDLTVWHNIIAWDQTAAYAERSFVKGSRIIVDGSIRYRTYPDKTGHTRYVTEIKAHSLMNLDR